MALVEFKNFPDTSTPLNAENLNNNFKEIFNLIYPVGSIYMSVSSTDPSTLFGGIWERWGNGRVPVGINTGDGDFNTVEKTGGSKTHTLTINEMPAHTHEVKYGTSSSVGLNADTSGEGYKLTYTLGGKQALNAISTGGNQAHSILQPYITCYMWKRVS